MRGTSACPTAPQRTQQTATTASTTNRRRALQNAASRASRSAIEASLPPASSTRKDAASASARTKRKRSADIEQGDEAAPRSQRIPQQEEAVSNVVEEGANTTRVPWKRPRPHDPIDVADDERLLEVVVANKASFEDPYKPVSLLWESIGMALGETSGYGVQPRVEYLREVWKNPSHTMHSAMTEKLKDLVKSYVDARQRRNDAILRGLRTSPSTSQPSKEPETPAAGRAFALKPLPAIPNGRKAIDIDVKLEEEVARIVLKHSPRFPEARSVVHVWQAIANDSRGRYNSRVIAQNRTLWLCKVASTPSHSKHYQLRPALRDMLLKILAHWNGVTSEEAIRSGDRRKVAQMTVDSKNDETLMSLVLEKRVYVEAKEDKSAEWTEIVETARHPGVQDSTTGVRRVLFLTRVFQHRSHEDHVKLTERLRFLLAKYSLASQKPQEQHRTGSDNAKVNSTTGVHNRHVEAGATESGGDEDDCSQDDHEDKTPAAAAGFSTMRPQATIPESPTTTPSTSRGPSKPVESQQDRLVHSLTIKVCKLENEQREMQSKTDAALCKLQEELRSQRDAHQREMTAMQQLLDKERRERKQDLIAIMELVSKPGLPHRSATAYPSLSSSSDANVNERCFI